MSPLMGLNVLAVVGPRIAKPEVTQAAGVDCIMLLGFVAAFCTIVVLIYQQKMRTRLPLLMMCLAALSVYGFLQGSFPLGFSLAALSASEFRRWCYPKTVRESALKKNSQQLPSFYERESRVARMFGSL